VSARYALLLFTGGLSQRGEGENTPKHYTTFIFLIYFHLCAYFLHNPVLCVYNSYIGSVLPQPKERKNELHLKRK
jgi:hypothetical protein